MPLKYKTKLVILFIIGLIIVLGSILYFFTSKTPSAVAEVVAVRLEIPSINVDAPIKGVGITLDGAMAAPEAADIVGWYSYGSQPGEKGSSVMAGHKGWKNDGKAVFDDLNKLQKGDSFSVLNSDGTRIHFAVRDIRLYDKDEIVPEIFAANQGVHLNLITCVGEWNEDLKSYSERWVVFADRVE